MNGIQRISETEKVYITVTEKIAEKNILLVRQEKKTDGWMQSPIANFTKQGELVVDLLPWALATAKACLKT